MSGRARRILVVEDETLLLKIYSAKLQKEGFDVVIAADGESAVRLAAEAGPDLILLDLILPKLNGFEALERIRLQPANAATPVLVLSNLGQEEDIARAKALGADEYLVKANLSIQEIIAKVRVALKD